MSSDSIVRALKARRSGSAWMALCPAHEDRNPSLSIREVSGKVLLHCHAGCSQRDVIQALKARGLWETERTERRRIAATYDYTDEVGSLLYQVVRFVPKTFMQRRPDGNGEWIWKKGSRQVLHHLPEVLQAPIVCVVEGEKDVETLRAHGFVATTIAGGANAKWLPTFTEALHGREVILVPDNDEPGWALMRRIADALLGQVARLVCFDDHHRAGAKDITEWFELGRSEIEFVNLLEAGCRSK